MLDDFELRAQAAAEPEAVVDRAPSALMLGGKKRASNAQFLR
jgi:hypothetical protein